MSEVARYDAGNVEAWAERITACWRQSVDGIFATGRLLAEAKEALPHGEFRAMCADKLPFKPRMVQMLMAIAKDARLSNAQYVAHLPPSWGTLYDLTRLDDAALDARILDGTINPAMERKAVATTVKQTVRATREVTLAGAIKALPQKRYGVILADPEWRFEPWSRQTGLDRAADNHYPTSCTEVIAARPVPTIAHDHAVLFLWATVPMLPHALLVMEAWGFDYRSHQAWVKDKPGTGYWFRNMHELLLVGIKGSKVPAPAPGQNWPSVVEAPVAEHSAKPVAFIEMIERLYPNLPKIELNARRRRDGWDAWGLEAPTEGTLTPEIEQWAETVHTATVPTCTPADGDVEPAPLSAPQPQGAGSPSFDDYPELPARFDRRHELRAGE
jgi:N6-adenosine-specific RNA methylase IME4